MKSSDKAVRAVKPGRHHLSLEKRRSLSGYFFVAPWVIGFAVFMVYALFKNLMFSLGKVVENVGLKTVFIGFANYIEIFTGDTHFGPAFLETIQMTFLWTPFIIVFALFLALLLNRHIKGKGIFRIIFFLPVLLGSGYIMQSVSSVNSVLSLPMQVEEFITKYFNAEMAEFFNDLLQQILSMFWSTGVQIVIFLSGLQSIPESYYEAARVDNAGPWDCLWKITIPLLSPTILLNTIFTIIESFSSESNPIAKLIVDKTWKSAQFEYAAAMGWIYFAVVLVIVGLVFLCTRRWVNYEK